MIVKAANIFNIFMLQKIAKIQGSKNLQVGLAKALFNLGSLNSQPSHSAGDITITLDPEQARELTYLWANQ